MDKPIAMEKVKFAKLLMNALPNKPRYQEDHFVQEIFRHSKYRSLSSNEKEVFFERIVRSKIDEAKRKPFDLFYPSYPLKQIMEGKKVLDLGCSIGGDTIFLGESWNVKEFYGIDVSEESISVANRYVSSHATKAQYHFMHSFAEDLPFEDDFFEAIVSRDTIEHVRSVKETLLECKRVLKKDGLAFLIFPSFKLPFGGAHIDSVTKTPFLEWFFSPNTLCEAHQEIVSEWGEDLNWYKPTEETKGDWAIVKGGIGVNGTTYKDFVNVAKEVGFSDISFVKIPLLYVSDTALKYPVVKLATSMLKPLLSIDYLKDYLSHRFAFVLKK